MLSSVISARIAVKGLTIPVFQHRRRVATATTTIITAYSTSTSPLQFFQHPSRSYQVPHTQNSCRTSSPSLGLGASPVGSIPAIPAISAGAGGAILASSAAHAIGAVAVGLGQALGAATLKNQQQEGTSSSR
ncbi:hypothetical protein NMY22_g19863 [Coprinellus aureogranulatus]|nr:hypothetical protein NMY22_g19863 [Coprinellus aureogranulatus]